MKKFLAILLSVMLVLAFSTVAFAAYTYTAVESGATFDSSTTYYTDQNGTEYTGGSEGFADALANGTLYTRSGTAYSIIIDNALKGETYTAYKIFNVVYSNPTGNTAPAAAATDVPGAADSVHENSAYSYTISDQSEWWSVVTSGGTVPATPALGDTFTANGLTFTKTANANEWTVEATNSFNAATFAQLLDANKTGKTSAASLQATDANLSGTTPHTSTSESYTTGSITLNVNDAGYYFVDTTAGALCSLDTTEPTATIREKNDLPTQQKTVCDTVDGTYGETATANIGDTVYFKIEVTDGVGTDAAITVHDTMSAGLTLGATSAFVVKAPVNGTETTLVQGQDYTVTAPGTDGHSFDLVINASVVAAVGTSGVITITYPATVNTDAVIASTGNPNESYITYQAQATPVDDAKVFTYAGAIYKVDGTSDGSTTNGAAPELAGATFAVTDSNGNPVGLTQISAGSASTPAIYRYDNSANPANTSIVTPASGAVVVYGFEDGTVLTLTETVAPTGFNLLSSPATLTINSTSTNTADKSATTNPGGATATFVASTYTSTTNNGETTYTLNVAGDDAGYQIAASSIEIIENKSGTELPSTGGIGTTIFYIVGAILVLGAGILIIAKRRSAAAEQ